MRLASVVVGAMTVAAIWFAATAGGWAQTPAPPNETQAVIEAVERAIHTAARPVGEHEVRVAGIEESWAVAAVWPVDGFGEPFLFWGRRDRVAGRQSCRRRPSPTTPGWRLCRRR